MKTALIQTFMHVFELALELIIAYAILYAFHSIDGLNVVIGTFVIAAIAKFSRSVGLTNDYVNGTTTQQVDPNSQVRPINTDTTGQS